MFRQVPSVVAPSQIQKINPNAIDFLLPIQGEVENGYEFQERQEHLWNRANTLFHSLSEEEYNNLPVEYLYIHTNGAVYANWKTHNGKVRWGRVKYFNQKYDRWVLRWENEYNVASQHYDEVLANEQAERFNLKIDSDALSEMESREHSIDEAGVR